MNYIRTLISEPVIVTLPSGETRDGYLTAEQEMHQWHDGGDPVEGLKSWRLTMVASDGSPPPPVSDMLDLSLRTISKPVRTFTGQCLVTNYESRAVAGEAPSWTASLVGSGPLDEDLTS